MASLRKPLTAGIVIVLLLFLLSVVLRTSTYAQDDHLSVVFFDVGQGDATFIQSPSGTQVLIDGGKNNTVLRGLSKAMGFFDTTLDMVVVTHPDLDHIGGLIDVLKKYKVSTIVMTENQSDSSAHDLLLEMIEFESATVLYARKGQHYDLGGGASLHVLFPDRDPTNLESNTSSIIAQLVYGENEFLFTGDSPMSIEEHLVESEGTDLESDVLKIGHHGSKTSTAETFVTAVLPSLAVISAGRDNSYGHPHQEVTDRLSNYGIPYKNTADDGSVWLVSDGEKIWFR